MSDQLSTSSLRMTWSRAPWDEAVYRYPVLQITSIEVCGPSPEDGIRIFEQERDRLDVGLVSCRLPHQCLRESMLLEDHGFRFIEMLYRPELELAKFSTDKESFQLVVARASDDDLPALLGIARTAFHHERFKMDPRLDPELSDQRYQNWVASCAHHPTQELYVVCDGERRVAFFVTEMLDDGTCYWHLNAVASDAQGQGYGRRAWQSMLTHASNNGALRVRTSIVARNNRVLNLYARLGFYFAPPSMTFHWVRPRI